MPYNMNIPVGTYLNYCLKMGQAYDANTYAYTTLDATGEKSCFTGQFFHPSRGSVNITKVHLYTAAVTSAGGSKLDVSLQDTGGASGLAPDNNKDQVCNIALSAVTNGGWTAFTLGSARTISHDAMLAVVIEYDSGGRLGSDTIRIAGHNTVSPGIGNGGAYGYDLAVGSWTMSASGVPVAYFECDDGSWGTFRDGCKGLNTGGQTFNASSTYTEWGQRFRVPAPCYCDGFLCQFQNFQVSGSDGTWYLREGTTELANCPINTTKFANGVRGGWYASWSPVKLLPGRDYYMSTRANVGTTQNCYAFYRHFPHMNCLTLHGTYPYSYRNTGSWIEGVTPYCFEFCPRIIDFLSMPSRPSMSGGML